MQCLISMLLRYCCVITSTADDYEALVSEPVSLGPTATVGDTECVTISLRDDEEVEQEQNFLVLLDADSNITSPGDLTRATVAIFDDDSKSVTAVSACQQLGSKAIQCSI